MLMENFKTGDTGKITQKWGGALTSWVVSLKEKDGEIVDTI
jgi:hypothetical protein